MKSTSSRLPVFVALVLLFGMVPTLAGCIFESDVTPPPPTVSEAEVKLRQKNDEMSQQLARQKKLTADLQMELLDKYAEVDRLTRVNERLVSEFVRSKAKLRNRGDKAETVRLIAEVDTVITTVRESRPIGHEREALARAEKYLAESKSELDQGNVEGASYLANQALEQVQEIQLAARGDDGRKEQGTLVDFLVPLPMKVLETSNVRKEPSLKARVKFVLGVGHKVTALGYQGQWVKVDIKGRGNGWIHYSLLIGARQ